LVGVYLSIGKYFQPKKSSMQSEKKAIVATIIAVVAVIVFLIVNPFVKVGAGQRGVVLKWGAVQATILDEGIHWITPLSKKVKKMDVTIQVEEAKATASSKDLQTVNSEVTINYHLDADKVNVIYQDLKKDYSKRIIEPAIQEFIKKATAQYTAEEVITKRENVKEDLKNALIENLSKNNIIVDDIFITDFRFSESFDSAIEAKVTAEQSALEAQNKLEQVKFEAAQRVAKAEAEAMAIKIQAGAIAKQGGKDYVALKAIEKWNGILPAQMIPNATLPFINLSK